MQWITQVGIRYPNLDARYMALGNWFILHIVRRLVRNLSGALVHSHAAQERLYGILDIGWMYNIAKDPKGGDGVPVYVKTAGGLSRGHKKRLPAHVNVGRWTQTQHELHCRGQFECNIKICNRRILFE